MILLSRVFAVWNLFWNDAKKVAKLFKVIQDFKGMSSVQKMPAQFSSTKKDDFKKPANYRTIGLLLVA